MSVLDMFLKKKIKRLKKTLVISTDISLSLLASYLSIKLLIPDILVDEKNFLIFIFINIGLFIVTFSSFRIYSNILRYSDVGYFNDLLYSIILYTIINVCINLFNVNDFSYDLILIQSLVFFFLLVSIRLVVKNFLNFNYNSDMKNIIIYGAGKAGAQLAFSISQSDKLNISAFIDDDNNKQGRKILDIKIYGYSNLIYLVKKFQIDEIYIAIPSLGIVERRSLIDELSKLNIRIRSLPRVEDLINENISLSDVKKVNLDDIIKRKINIDQLKIDKSLNDKTILITGSGGSIGRELSLQCLKCRPKSLIIIDHSEFNLYAVEEEIHKLVKDNNQDTKVFSILVSVRDIKKLDNIFKKYEPDIIFHAAAYKHVSFGERNQIEFLDNNILGTYNVALLSIKYNCKNFTLVSTDKAVRPSNIMGASKRFAEMIVQSLYESQEKNKKTIFSIVRFGNVIGSSGSVVPLFQSQINNGGPVTVTHPEVTRYFMTIPEAVSLILLSSSIAKDAEVFVLDMGEPMKIKSLAEKLISLSGKVPTEEKDNIQEDEILINYIGLKPGEKLHEELVIGENILRSEYKDILIAKEKFIPWKDLEKFLEKISEAINLNDLDKSINVLQEVIEDFRGQTDF